MSQKVADVRFYVDADLLGLGKLLVSVRPDVTYPGDPGGSLHKRVRPPCVVEKAAEKDDVWIPKVAARGWLIITRDRRIQEHRAEVGAVKEHGARMIALASDEARNTFAQLEVLMCQWRAIEDLVNAPAPFIYTANRSGLRQIDLDGGAEAPRLQE